MTVDLTNNQSFIKNLAQLFQESKKAQTDKHKEKVWQHFLDMGLPIRRSEVFQYIPLRTLYERSFAFTPISAVNYKSIASHILPECEQSLLVLTNGFFRPDLCRVKNLPKRVVILSIAAAYQTYGNFLNSQFTKLLKDEKDPFSLLNAALYQSGLFLYIPPKTTLTVPLQIMHVTNFQSPTFMAPRIQGFVGSHSEVTMINTHMHFSGSEAFCTHSTDLCVEENARLNFIQTPFQLPKQFWYFDAFRASLKKNSRLKTVLVNEGTATLRNDYRITLTGENAEASLNGISLLSKRSEFHTNVLMEHQAPYCRSNQLFKNVLNDAARASFEGKIFVHSEAQKTEAFQLNNNLLLSDQAKSDTKPNLEIYAADVKASHGATIGQLNQEQLFYLKARGYPEKLARNLLVFGFCKEVLDLLPPSSLNAAIDRWAKNYLMRES